MRVYLKVHGDWYVLITGIRALLLLIIVIIDIRPSRGDYIPCYK